MKAKHNQRTVMTAFMQTPAEKAQLRALAENIGWDMSTVIRMGIDRVAAEVTDQ